MTSSSSSSKDFTTNANVVLIGGGVRCGKSRFGLQKALAYAPKRVLIATAQPFDDEMKRRISNHVAERGDRFDTIEEPIHLGAAIEQASDANVILIDCLTLWLSNLLLQSEPTQSDTKSAQLEQLKQTIDASLAAIYRAKCPVICITNEVGMGVVPEHRLGRIFRDLCGYTHQSIAGVASEIYMGMMGTMLRIKPAPIEPIAFSHEFEPSY